MMLRNLLYILLFLPLVFLMSCNSREASSKRGGSMLAKADSLEAIQEEHQRKSNTPGPDTMSFATAFSHFYDALQSSDTVKLQQYLDPKRGVWIIEQPGAVPKMTHVRDLTRFRRDYQNRSFFSIKNELTTCDLEMEPFPAFDCADMDQGSTGYAKDGCFATDASAIKQSQIWDYASLSAAELRQVQAMLPLLQQSVLHTPSSFRFHFGFDKGRWYVYFVDLRIPCSA